MKIKQIPEQYETHWLNDLPVKGVIAMEDNEIRFLNGVIREVKPKKLLEIGVHRGGSSMLMLNAVRDDSTAHLYSVDYARVINYGVTFFGLGNKNYAGPDDGKKIGWAVGELTPELLPGWTLFTGGYVAEFIEKIWGGGGIDLCFLDTAHQLPGEILDFLVILPYLSKDAIVVQHDAVLDHASYTHLDNDPLFNLTCIASPVLFAVMRSEKLKPVEFDGNRCPTAGIGAHQINDDTWKYVDDIFWALNLKWRYLPTDRDMEHIINILEKHYDRRNVDMFLKNYELNKKVGVNKNPFAVSGTPKKSDVESSIGRLIDRIIRLEKRTYTALAGILGFLAAAVIGGMMATMWVMR
jgi:hypothetical protein